MNTGTEIIIRVVFRDTRDSREAAAAIAEHLVATFNDDGSIVFIEDMDAPVVPVKHILYRGSR